MTEGAARSKRLLRIRRYPGDVLVATMPVELPTRARPRLLGELEATLREGVVGLVIDLSRTRLIDSAGLSAILTVHKRAADLGLAVALCCARGQVCTLLTLARIDELMMIFGSRTDAVGELQRLRRLGKIGPA